MEKFHHFPFSSYKFFWTSVLLLPSLYHLKDYIALERLIEFIALFPKVVSSFTEIEIDDFHLGIWRTRVFHRLFSYEQSECQPGPTTQRRYHPGIELNISLVTVVQAPLYWLLSAYPFKFIDKEKMIQIPLLKSMCFVPLFSQAETGLPTLTPQGQGSGLFIFFPSHHLGWSFT